MTELPTQIGRLYAALDGGGDVAIDALLAALGANVEKNRQQYLGPYIVRLNRRLKAEGKKVVPGRVKQTYALKDA